MRRIVHVTQKKKKGLFTFERFEFLQRRMVRKTTTTKKSTRQLLSVQKKIEKTESLLKELKSRYASLEDLQSSSSNPPQA
jgi:hypothetical protein